jgi:hypothetical protein
VTLVGLAHAYTRARFGLGLWPWLLSKGLELWQWILSKLRGRGPDQTISGIGIPSGEAFGHFTISGDGYVSFTLDTTKSVEDQLDQLATHVRKLDAIFPPIRQDIIRLNGAVADARQHAETLVSQALIDATGHTEKRSPPSRLAPRCWTCASPS